MQISLEEAAKLLLAGEVVAIPTETVYGLAARYDLPTAVNKVFQLKNRPDQNPLIIHLSKQEDISRFCSNTPPHFHALASQFWPGPLTLVIPIDTAQVPAIVRANLPTQAFRVPSHPLTQTLLKLTGPLVAPSANLSGRPSAVSPEHVADDFGPNLPILSGGVSEKGVESTILIWSGEMWDLGRMGAISAEAFESTLGYTPVNTTRAKPLCPGQLFQHYAPKARLILKVTEDADTIIGFTDRSYPPNATVLRWGSSKNPDEVLQHLYTTLRQLDKAGLQNAWVDIDVPKEGLWLTFLERLIKASSRA